MNTSPPPFPASLYVDPLKITAYILAHPSKASPFLIAGFSPYDPDAFEAAIKRHGFHAPMKSSRPAKFGPEWNYVFEGPLTGPAGTIPMVRSVWCAAPGDMSARFVTAHKL